MEFWGTKSQSEREDEEDERLVRPAPKKKPPRRDRRRERVQPEEDPDKEKDLDQSLNFKDIGGSVRWSKSERVPAISTETGEVVQVSQETLKDKPGEYKEVKPEDAKAKPEEKKPEPEEAPVEVGVPKEPKSKEEFYQGAGQLLQEMAGKDPEVASKLQKFVSPKQLAHRMVKEFPDLPAELVLKGVELPEGVKTIADVQKAMKATPKKEEPETAEEKPEKKPAEEPEKPAEAAEEKPGEKPAEEPEKPTKEPKKKKEKPKEEKPEPSEAKKAGIGDPKRRDVTPAEQQEALSLVVDTFPPKMAASLIAQDMHPDDIRDMVAGYQAAKARPVGNTAKFAEKAATFYQTDTNKVKPPKNWKTASGETVPFESLPPDEKAEAMRQHQLQTVAMSLAAKEQLSYELTMPSITNKPRVPPEVAERLASAMLSKGKTTPPKTWKTADGEEVPFKDLSSEDQAKAMSQLETAGVEKAAQEAFDSALASGTHTKISNGVIKKLLKNMSSKPGAQKVAKAFLQANDYHAAKARFLDPESKHSVSERDEPADIMKGLRKASSFFRERAGLYGEESHSAAKSFETKVLDRLKSLEPQKYQKVRAAVDLGDAAKYDKAEKAFKKEHEAWKKSKESYKSQAEKPPEGESAEPFAEYSPDVAPKAFDEPEPQPPIKPARYGLAKNPKKLQDEGDTQWDDFMSRMASQQISTYSSVQAMGKSNSKTGVYHGIDPKENDPGSYPERQAVHQRDLGEADFKAVVDEAKKWLKTPVLSKNVEGMIRGQQLRAALDLAIKSAKYDRAFNPKLYDELLTRLAKSVGETLKESTQVSDVVSKPMSSEIQELAAVVAKFDSNAAYTMTALASRLVEDEHAKRASSDKFSTLRSYIIRTAAADAKAKKVLLPILQAVKDLG
jgi:hypothetical protein